MALESARLAELVMTRAATVPPSLLSLAAARELIAVALLGRETAVERLALEQAQSRFLAAAIQAPMNLPPFANSAMDGYAVRALDVQDATRLTLVGRSLAGAASPSPLLPGQAMRITTGAPLPAGADTVIIQENCRVEDSWLYCSEAVRAGANVRLAGEDLAQGQQVLGAGQRLGPAQLALLAAIGHSEVRVRTRPRVAVISTGDELIAPGERLAPGQIHDSNGPMLAALVAACGGRALPGLRVADDPQALHQALVRCAGAADLIITAGGASVGDADHLPQVLREHGHVHFWKLKLRPGMPCLFGELEGCPVLSLPGNPVSAYASFLVLGRFALRVLLGVDPADPPALPVRLAVAVSKRHDRLELQRCQLQFIDQVLTARPLGAQGSHQLRGLRDADGLLELPEGQLDWPAGHWARAWRLNDWLD